MVRMSSGFPAQDDTSATAAHYLFHNVICDLAGYPAAIGSDQGQAFVHGVVQSLIKLFGVNHVIGTAYHPQAQSAVERPHRGYNKICQIFMTDTRDWDLMVPIFVWTIRTSTKLFIQWDVYSLRSHYWNETSIAN